jgi:hypothetical protein
MMFMVNLKIFRVINKKRRLKSSVFEVQAYRAECLPG